MYHKKIKYITLLLVFISNITFADVQIIGQVVDGPADIYINASPGGVADKIYGDTEDVSVTIDNAALDHSGESLLFASNGANADLIIKNGGTLSAQNLFSQQIENSTFNVDISGVNSLLDIGGSMVINFLGKYPSGSKDGYISNLDFKLRDGARFDANMVRFADPTGSSNGDIHSDVLISGQNTILNVNDLSLFNSIDLLVNNGAKLNLSFFWLFETSGQAIIDNASVEITDAAGSGVFVIGGGGSWVGPVAPLYLYNGASVSAKLADFDKHAILGGDGTLTTLTGFFNGGTIKPGLNSGNDTGTLNVVGDYEHETTAVLEVSPGTNKGDLLAIDGDATISGGTLRVTTAGEVEQTAAITVLSADSVTGTFDTVESFDETLFLKYIGTSYDANKVKVSIEKKSNYEDIAQTKKQKTIGAMLDSIETKSSDLSNVLGDIQQMSVQEEAESAFDEIAGTDRNALVDAALDSIATHTGVVNQRLHVLHRGGESNFASPVSFNVNTEIGFDSNHSFYVNENNFSLSYGAGSKMLPWSQWGLWIKGYGAWGDKDTDDDYAGYAYKQKGLSFGMDKRIHANWLLGLSAGGSEADMKFTNSDNAEIFTKHYSLYTSYIANDFYSDIVLNYTTANTKNFRHINFGSIARTAEADYDSDLWSLYWEIGKEIKLDHFKLRPFAAYQVTRVKDEAHDETGADSLNLSVAQKRSNTHKVSLGAEISKEIKINKRIKFEPSLRARWTHEIKTKDDVTKVRLSSSGVDYFELISTKDNKDIFEIGVGLTQNINDNLKLDIGYDYVVSEDQDMHIGSFTFRKQW